MSLNGSHVGVTSHTTPLPAGEGLGEGPLSCRGNLTYHGPHCGGEVGGGAAIYVGL